MKLRRLKNTLLVVTSSLISTLLLATEHAGHGAHAGHGEGGLHINWWAFDPHAPALGWLLVDFAVFVLILYWFGRKPMAAFLQNRSNAIRTALEEARQAKAEAEARAAELEQRVKALDGELQQIREDIKRLGENERERLIAEGEKAARRMLADTELQIQNELDRARASLKNQALDEALALAEQQLRAQMTAKDYSRLNSEFTQSLVKGEELSQ
jgi:F-type H+-transporting ATPase subunit b